MRDAAKLAAALEQIHPGKQFSTVIEEIGAECDGSFAVYKVDIDECEDVAMDYAIMSVPTLIVFKDGQEAARMIGVQPKTAILDAVKVVIG